GHVARNREQVRIAAAGVRNDVDVAERRLAGRVMSPDQVLRVVVVDVVGLITGMSELTVELEAGRIALGPGDGVIPVGRVHVRIEEDPSLRSAEGDAPVARAIS